MPKVVMIANQKGGVCKTTTSSALSFILNSWGHKTLLIDADHQRNGSDTYHAVSDGVATIYDLILDDNPCPIEEAIQHTEYGDVIAGDKGLVFSDRKIQNADGYFKLKNALDSLTGYEYVVIDSRPDFDAVLFNLLVATDIVVIPVNSGDRYSVMGLDMFIDAIRDVQSHYNPSLKLEGILICNYDGRQKFDRAFKEQAPGIAAAIGTKVFNTVIRRNVACRDAQTERIPLKLYNPKCNAEKDYEAFAEELLGVREA